jgi:rSAM/selenodomain-associated transferase 2
VAGASSTRHEAAATRRVTGFDDTSTIRARPSRSRWLKEGSDISEVFRRRFHDASIHLSPAHHHEVVSARMRLAIVIPTLNEEAALAANLPAALALADEVWVADGGSADATVEIAGRLGARVVSGPPGRGPQLNRGARAAAGEILIFLHADSRLPGTAARLVTEAVRGGAVGGGFRVRYDDPRTLLRWGGRLIELRTRVTGCPLGDQAQFVTRRAYEALGGFRDWPILEDLDFIRRLKRHGQTVVLDAEVTTSARRVLEEGVAKSVATNWMIWGLYLLGVSPHRLARLYRHIR